MSVIFFGSSSFSAPALRSIQLSVTHVVTRKTKPKGRGYLLEDNEVKREALTLGLPLIELDSFRNDEQARQISGLNPELLVVVSFGLIIPKWFLGIPTIGAINVHPSLLPKYRGPSPIQWAIRNGEEVTGITVISMSEKMDAGGILYQEEFPIGSEEDAASLSDRLSARVAQILPATVADVLIKGTKHAKQQRDENATYTPIITREMGRIDWRVGSTEIVRQVRALVPWPTAHTVLEGKTLKVFRAKDSPGSHIPSVHAGTILAQLPAGIEVAAGEGSVVIQEVQLENKRRMGASDFARGYRQIVGKRFE